MLEVLRSMLFVPGNNPAMLQAAGVFGADAVILDLEDAVALREKDAARFLVAEALQSVDFKTSAKVVRINTLETGGAEDLRRIVACAGAKGTVGGRYPGGGRIAGIVGTSGAVGGENHRPD